MKTPTVDTQQLLKNVATNGLNGRLTLRLPEHLLVWVRQQGGSSYVRDLLLGQRNGTTEKKLQQPPLRPESCSKDERDLLAMDRELLDDEEQLLDRRETRLDKERELLNDQREQLEDEWCELEEVRENLDDRKDLLATTQVLLSYFPQSLPPIIERP